MPDAEIIPFPVRPVNKLASDMALVYGFGGDQPIVDLPLVNQVLADRRDYGVLGGSSAGQ